MARKPRASAWLPCDDDVADITALRALKEGGATEAQQIRAFNWIIESACDFRSEPFRSDSDGGERETTFHLGRHYVARRIFALLTIPETAVSELRKKND